MATCTMCIGRSHIIIVAQLNIYVNIRLCLLIYHEMVYSQLLTDIKYPMDYITRGIFYEKKLVLLLFLLDRFNDLALICQVFPEQHLATLDVHDIFGAVELFSELGERQLVL